MYSVRSALDDELVNVVELVPVLICLVHPAVQGLEFGSSGDAHVERLGGEKSLLFEEVEVVPVRQVRQQLTGETVQRRHDGQRQLPLAVARPIHKLGPLQRVMVVEPLVHRRVFLLVEFELDRLQGVHVEEVIRVIQRRLLVVEGRERDSLEVPPIALLSTHHDPHRAPLSDIHGLDHLRSLVDEGDGAGDVVDDLAVTRLLPGHGHVLQELEDGVRDKLERAKIHALVVAELARGHVAVILDDLAHVLRSRGEA